MYRKTKTHMNDIHLLPLEEAEMYELAERLAEIAHKNHIIVESCAKKINLEQFGIKHGHCIDCNLFERILDCKMDRLLSAVRKRKP